jgi:arabinose-5-phosphate isomerase
MISKSGESDELLQLVPFLRNRGAKLFAITNNVSSRLAKGVDVAVTLPLLKELCPFDLAPTTSAVIQMIFGDVLSIALMMKKNFSLVDYAMNHPAGKIGRRLTIKVKDLMLSGKDIPMAGKDDKLVDTLVELSNKKCGCVLIVDKERHLIGIFTDGDLRRSLQKHGSSALEMALGTIMSKEPRTISQDAMASQAVAVMEGDLKRPITVLAVVDESKRVLGVIKLHDVLQSGL